MSGVLMGLGSFRFEVTPLNYQELERKIENRWEPQNRVGARPAMQYFGPGVEDITISGVIYPTHPLFAGGAQRYEELRSPVTARRPHRLASNAGRYFGLWIIKDVADNSTHINPGGQPRKLEFDLHLQHFGSASPVGGAVALF